MLQITKVTIEHFYYVNLNDTFIATNCLSSDRLLPTKQISRGAWTEVDNLKKVIKMNKSHRGCRRLGETDITQTSSGSHSTQIYNNVRGVLCASWQTIRIYNYCQSKTSRHQKGKPSNSTGGDPVGFKRSNLIEEQRMTTRSKCLLTSYANLFKISSALMSRFSKNRLSIFFC